MSATVVDRNDYPPDMIFAMEYLEVSLIWRKEDYKLNNTKFFSGIEGGIIDGVAWCHE